jgi:hypothetical protein
MGTLPHRRQVRLSVHPRYREREPVTFQVNADFGNITDEVRIRRHEHAHGGDSVLLRHSPHQGTRLCDHLRRCDIVGRYTFGSPVENFVHNLQWRGHGRIAQILNTSWRKFEVPIHRAPFIITACRECPVLLSHANA